MRPLNAAELLKSRSQDHKLAKPQFLSKKKRLELQRAKEDEEREKTELKRKTNTLKRSLPSEPETILDQKDTSTANKKRKKRFNFEWDDEEDTSSQLEPMMAYPTSNNDFLPAEEHWLDKKLEDMTSRDWRIFKEDFSITCKGNNIPNPLRSWKESGIPTTLLNTIDQLGYKEPTPIQRAAIPTALGHRDVVGIAETGSGKTLAFLIPLLSYLSAIDKDYMEVEHKQESNLNKVLGLVLAPTRELALQISKEAKKFASVLGYNVVTIIGGHQYEETVKSVQDGAHIVVATPGRLIDSAEKGLIDLSQCYHLTMDEADRMIDMGFEKALQSILSFLPSTSSSGFGLDSTIFKVKSRITLMFTATISPPIEKITKDYLQTPAYLYIGDAGEIVDNINQKFEYLGDNVDSQEELNAPRTNKMILALRQHIRETEQPLIIIFANFKRTCELLSVELSNQNVGSNIVIHGSKSQEARESAIASFREHKVNVLIATDVAARGIDIPNVSLVVNYHMPKRFHEYIHRIGRTGRAGKSGASLSFVDDGDSEILMNLKSFLSKGTKRLPDWLLRHPAVQSLTLKD